MKPKVNHLRIVMATVMMSIAASQISVQAAPSSSGVPKLKFEPRSYAEFIGANPHPDWLDGALTPDGVQPMVGPAMELPNVILVAQPHTHPDPSPFPCSTYFGVSPLKIMETKVVPASDTVSVEASMQPSIPEGNGFAGVALICTVTQGATVRACSGTLGEPIMAIRIKPSQFAPIGSWRGSNAALSGYHGFVSGLTPYQEATVTIAARTFSTPAGVLGQVCYGSLAVNYLAPPL
jgi:hypothetical protein